MVNQKAIILALLFSPLFAPNARGVDSYEVVSFGKPTLGKQSSAAMGAGNPAGTQAIQTAADITLLGKVLSPFSTRIETPDGTTIGNTSYTTVYSFGKRVFSDAWTISSDGDNHIALGLAPTEVRVPAVSYPVGPLLLNVDGGVRFQAYVSANLVPEIAIPLPDSNLRVDLYSRVQGAGFVEGYAQFVIIRGGVGGQLNLIDGEASVNGRVGFNSTNPPVVLVSGVVSFFNGSIYSFLDIFGFLSVHWRRLHNGILYNWNGTCFSMGSRTCPAR